MATIDPIDPFASGVDVSSTDDQFSEIGQLVSGRLKKMGDYDKNLAKYHERLNPFMYEQPKMSFYELASELGAGLLSTPNIGGASAFTGLGVGFTNASERMKAIETENSKARQQIALQAAQMAMQD